MKNRNSSSSAAQRVVQQRLGVLSTCLLFVCSLCAYALATPNYTRTTPGHQQTTRPRRLAKQRYASRRSVRPVAPSQAVAEGDVGERLDWFYSKRAYPLGYIPEGARRRAWESRPKGRLGVTPQSIQFVWQPIGPVGTVANLPAKWGVVSARITAIAVSPANPQIVLIGTPAGGILRSTDGGAHFTPVSDDQVDLAVGSIAFAPSQPNIVYAGMGDKDGYSGTGVLKSVDAGQTWTHVTSPTAGIPEAGIIRRVIVHPTDANRVYVAQMSKLSGNIKLNSGVYVSPDGGLSWQQLFSGGVSDVALQPGNPQTIYCALLLPQNPGVYKSTDGGSTWNVVYQSPYMLGSKPYATDLYLGTTPADPQRLYLFNGNITIPDIRVEVSMDAGATWTNKGAAGVDQGQFGYNSFLTVDPQNANTVYIGTRDVYRSTNGGTTWTNLTDNWTLDSFNYAVYHPDHAYTHTDMQAFALAPNDPNTFYVGNDGGLAKTTDGGSNYQSLNETLSLAQIVGYALHPTDPTVSLAGTQDNGPQRRDGTTRWRTIDDGDGGRVLFDPFDPTIFYTSIQYGALARWHEGDRVGKVVGSATLYGATDGRIGFYPPIVNNGIDQKLYVGTTRLHISVDRGDTWTTPGGNLRLGKTMSDLVNAIGVARANTNVIYTGSMAGVAMVSTDEGHTWTNITAGLPNRAIESIAVDPTNPALAYLSVSGYGTGHVFKTTNMGAQWTDVSGNLPNIPTNDLLVDLRNPQTIYAATDIGVFRSTTGGNSWETFNQGMPPTVVTAFAQQPSGRIHAATYGRGAYELTQIVIPGPVSFSAPNYSVAESAGHVHITVTRSDTTSAASVDYATVDGTASERTDYTTAHGTLSFAAGEASKSFDVAITDDAYVETAETFQVQLANPVNLTLATPSTATVTIQDNDTAGESNPIFNSTFFVRQQYLDFLAREPEPNGLQAWLGVLNSCADLDNSPACDRILVSSSFFGSPEFQLKGFYVFRFYKLAFNRLPEYAEMMPDMSSVTGQTSAEVYNKKAAFADAFTGRPEFHTTYDALANADYVTKLLGRYGLTSINTPDPAHPDDTTKVTLTTSDLAARLNANTLTRAQVLRAVADSDQVAQAEYNQAFVAMQYYGYLRRTPEPAGYQAWLNYLNANPTDFRTMINGFMNSTEYRLRFGAQTNSQVAYFTFDVPPFPQTFTFKLNDPGKIAQARSLLGQQKIVSGVIVKSPASFNQPWHFQLAPSSINFVDLSVEVCDANIQDVEAHLSEVGGQYLPGNRWCPWSARLLREEHPAGL
jgi:photosystem II stability/assembly factor-like uncharacterized protein